MNASIIGFAFHSVLLVQLYCFIIDMQLRQYEILSGPHFLVVNLYSSSTAQSESFLWIPRRGILVSGASTPSSVEDLLFVELL